MNCQRIKSHANNYAVMKKELESYYGTICHIIPISSINDVITGWDSMDANGTIIDTVVFDFHAWQEGIQFTDANGKSIGTFEIKDISSLKQQTFDQLIYLDAILAEMIHKTLTVLLPSNFFYNNRGLEW